MHIARRLLRPFLALAIAPLLLFSIGAIGTVIGQVADANGNLIANAQVSSPGIVVTMSSGTYRGKFASSGTYLITASAPGYVSQSISVTCPGGAVTTQNFVLRP